MYRTVPVCCQTWLLFLQVDGCSCTCGRLKYANLTVFNTRVECLHELFLDVVGLEREIEVMATRHLDSSLD